VGGGSSKFRARIVPPPRPPSARWCVSFTPRRSVQNLTERRASDRVARKGRQGGNHVSRMTWFRTIRGIVPWLIGLFLVAQLSGIVPAQPAHAHLGSEGMALQVHHHHAHQHHGERPWHHDGSEESGSLSDKCCALHAFMTGILPPAVASDPAVVLASRLVAIADQRFSGLAPDRLDRPPRPLPLI